MGLHLQTLASSAGASWAAILRRGDQVHREACMLSPESLRGRARRMTLLVAASTKALSVLSVAAALVAAISLATVVVLQRHQDVRRSRRGDNSRPGVEFACLDAAL